MRLRLAAALMVLAAAVGRAQERVVIADRGPGAGGRILEEALARPHRLVQPDTSWFTQGRGQQERGTIIVLGRTTAIAGTVDGDVIVVGGDLFVRPGARIEGRAAAMGGGVYASALASIGQGTHDFRDYTYDIVRDSTGYRLTYRSQRADATPPLTFPAFYGVRPPTYDRVNGLSIPFGPAFTFADGRGELNALATYRSDLGKVDPSLSADLQLTRRLRTSLRAERGTFSNDAWILSNFVNSFTSLVAGTDTRNYYRADRADVTVHRLWEFARTRIEPFVGVRGERAWSVGPAFGEQRGPWSIMGRQDAGDGMWRANPAIGTGEIYSALVGSTAGWDSDGITLRGRSILEHSLNATTGNAGAQSTVTFSQVTSDLDVGFPTFREQTYAFEVHWVTSPGDSPPPQRFVYFGGAGTMPFLTLLEQSGDELLLVEQRYAIPFPNVQVGFMGIPTLQLRHRVGGAGFGRLPALEQLVSVGVMLTIIRAELQIDPASGRTRGSVGFTFSR